MSRVQRLLLWFQQSWSVKVKRAALVSGCLPACQTVYEHSCMSARKLVGNRCLFLFLLCPSVERVE